MLADQCGSNIKMVQGLEPLLTEAIILYRSQPHLPSRQIFFEQSRKIVHPSSANWWRRKTRSIRWKTEEMSQSKFNEFSRTLKAFNNFKLIFFSYNSSLSCVFFFKSKHGVWIKGKLTNFKERRI